MLFTLIRNELKKIFSRGKTYVISILFVAFVGMLFVGSYINEKRMNQINSPEGRVSQLEENNKWMEEDLKNLDSNSSSDVSLETRKLQMKEQIEKNKTTIDTLKKQIDDGTIKDNWKDELNIQIDDLKDQLKDETLPNRYKASIQSDLDKLNYYKDNNLKPINSWDVTGFNFMDTVMSALGMIFLAVGIALFMSDMVSGEFTPATMKFLLIQPVSRGKVLLSKFIAVVISCVTLILSIETVAFLLVGLLRGFGYSGVPTMFGARYQFDMSQLQDGVHPLVQIAGTGEQIPLWNFTIRTFFMQALFIIACCAFVFLVSSLVKTSMISMAVTTSITVLIQILTEILSPMKKISHYLFTTYGDAGQILSGRIALQYNNPNITIGFSIGLLLISTIVFYIISHVTFTKRDILI